MAGGLTSGRPTSLIPNPRMKSKSTVGRTYEWFLELPVPMVLLTMWVAGMLLIGSLVGLLYLLWSLLLTVAATG